MATAVKPRLTRAFLEYHGYTIHKNIMAQHSNIKFTYINLRDSMLPPQLRDCSQSEGKCGDTVTKAYEDADVVKQIDERKELGRLAEFTSSENSQRARKIRRHTVQQVDSNHVHVEPEVMLTDESIAIQVDSSYNSRELAVFNEDITSWQQANTGQTGNRFLKDDEQKVNPEWLPAAVELEQLSREGVSGADGEGASPPSPPLLGSCMSESGCEDSKSQVPPDAPGFAPSPSPQHEDSLETNPQDHLRTNLSGCDLAAHPQSHCTLGASNRSSKPQKESSGFHVLGPPVGTHIRFADSEDELELACTQGPARQQAAPSAPDCVLGGQSTSSCEADQSQSATAPEDPLGTENHGSGDDDKQLNSPPGPTGLRQELVPEGVSQKYWNQRYRLFSRFDEGIQMDPEGWFSVTPEELSIHQARRCACGVLVDPFAGVGGNSIQFARTCASVLALDIDPQRLSMASHNAAVYQTEASIEFVCADFLEVGSRLKADGVFLSPPWGGPEYVNAEHYDLNGIKPLDAYALLDRAQAIAPSVAMFLPRNVDPAQIVELAKGQHCEVELNFMNRKLKAITVYFGEFAQRRK